MLAIKKKTIEHRGQSLPTICSNTEDRDKRLMELRDKLLARDYIMARVDSAIEKARKVPRDRALKISNKPKTNQRPVLVVPYDPRFTFSHTYTGQALEKYEPRQLPEGGF